MYKLKIRELVFVSLFIALITVGTFIRIPVGADVYTLQFLFTLMAGLVLGARLGALAYHKAFPAQGRPWGFMWRIGPRFTYKYTSHNSISLGYMMSHHSNGMKTKNPGHNAIGFSLGLNHTF